eukprot:scaffold19628_cov87-Phaeocystis_antarctica.AAC.1
MVERREVARGRRPQHSEWPLQACQLDERPHDGGERGARVAAGREDVEGHAYRLHIHGCVHLLQKRIGT